MPMRERYKVAVTKKNIVCMTSPMGGISVTILLYLTKDISKSKGRGNPPYNTRNNDRRTEKTQIAMCINVEITAYVEVVDYDHITMVLTSPTNLKKKS